MAISPMRRIDMSTGKKAQAAAAAIDTGSGTRLSSNASASRVTFSRRFPRYSIDMRLQVKMFQAGEFRTCWGRSTEMGQDGIGATLTGSLEPGEIVTLEIPLPLAPYPIKVRAIVRYRQGLRYGFEFLTLNEGQRDTIQRVCQYLNSKG
jgi:PilZ domain